MKILIPGGTGQIGRMLGRWFHERDFCRAIDWLIAHDWSGPVNLCAPNPLPNAEFMRELCGRWRAANGA